MSRLRLDLKTASRQLRRAPWTTLAAVLTLAIGIASTTAVFSFVAAVLSAGAPADDMDRRVALWSHNRQETETKNAVSEGDLIEWRRRATLLADITAVRRGSANLAGAGGSPVRVDVSYVLPNYLDFFKWRPALGRGLSPADAVAVAPRVVVLSYAFWRTAMGGRPDVVGATVRLDGEPAAVVGVLPRLPAVEGVYVPLSLDVSTAAHDVRNLFVWARLNDGVTIEQARDEMIRIGADLERELPQTNRGWTVNTRPLQEEFVGPQARLALAILLGAVVAVLLIGCANVANLYLARGAARQGEMAVRMALGAGGWQLTRQLFVECGVIAAAGALLSLPLARAIVQLFVSIFAIDSPWVEAAGLNPRAMLFTAAAAVTATFASGLAPALAARKTSVIGGLYATSRSGVGGTRRLTRMLVSGEIALAVVFLLVASLLTRTLSAIEQLDPGFDLTNVLTASITLPERTNDTAAVQWMEEAITRTRALPGVVAAGATSRLPFVGSRFNANRGLVIEGRSIAPDGGGTWAVDYAITPGFIEALKVPVLEGRAFTNADGRGAPMVAIVNQAMARRFWPNHSPLGARLRQGNEPAGQWRTVVGVMADIRNDDADQPPIPYLYVPIAQQPLRTFTIAARTLGNPTAIVEPLRQAMAMFDPDQALYDVRTMEDVFEADLASSRVLIQVMGAFAVVALGLAGLGVWGVSAQAVAQRTREIGVRVALGATAGRVGRLVVFQALIPVAVGLSVGLLGGFGLGRLLRSVLFQVSPTDSVATGFTIAVLALVALAATLGPALRAARLDPLVALRIE